MNISFERQNVTAFSDIGAGYEMANVMSILAFIRHIINQIKTICDLVHQRRVDGGRGWNGSRAVRFVGAECADASGSATPRNPGMAGQIVRGLRRKRGSATRMNVTVGDCKSKYLIVFRCFLS